jgi:hypothetical protein
MSGGGAIDDRMEVDTYENSRTRVRSSFSTQGERSDTDSALLLERSQFWTS